LTISLDRRSAIAALAVALNLLGLTFAVAQTPPGALPPCPPRIPSAAAPVDPELRVLQAALPRGGGPRTPETMPKVRADFRAWHAARPDKGPAPPQDVRVTEQRVPGPPGAPPVRVVVYSPPGPAVGRPALIDIHGGSYVLGFPEMNDTRNRNLSKDLGAVVVSIDYRLGPEHPFPAGLEDSYAVLQWVAAHAAALGIDPGKIAVAGDSAGGGIAGGLTLLARDRKGPQIMMQVQIYGSVGDRPVGPATCTPAQPRPGPMAYFTEAGLKHDLGPYAFPARAATLSGLPPTYIAVGALDGLAESNLNYARHLIAAGVPTEVHVYPGAFHGFDMAFGAQVSQRFYADLRAALRRAWAQPAR